MQTNIKDKHQACSSKAVAKASILGENGRLIFQLSAAGNAAATVTKICKKYRYALAVFLRF
jgi:hypothetical protein